MSTGKLIDDLADLFDGTLGEDLEPTLFLDTGFEPLNQAITGDYHKGMPCGRLIEMFGPPSCGKTAIATSMMASAINAGGFALFMDHERSFEPELAKSLGLDIDSGRFARLKPLTFEQSFKVAIHTANKIREEEMIPPTAPILVVFDSLAAMVPASKMEKEVDEMTMADSLSLAKATSTQLPVMAMWAEKLNMTILLLNQTRENPGVTHGDNTRTPGGKAPSFYCSLRIKLSASQLRDDKTKTVLGQRVTATVIKNKLNRPFARAEWNFVFQDDGKGHFDAVGGLVDHLCEIGKLEQSGARVNWKGKSYFKSQLGKIITDNGEIAELKALLPS